MPLRLRDNLCWCNCDGRIVFLDIALDRYFCLGEEANLAFLRFASGTMDTGDAAKLEPLVARGVLIDALGPRLPNPPLIDSPEKDYLPEPLRRARLRSVVRALASELRSAFMLRTMAFQKVIDRARQRPPHVCADLTMSNECVHEIVAGARAASFILRSHDRCLVRALAVHRVCKSNGIRAKLVLGVIAHPFTAHCWVQLGSAVLVGGYEQARLYTPILVVE
ncbi:MAG TPA: lasso peptide biosynthesis B2 protein [Sphingomicrobium sp.]|nr:lasso peptide biosynthesis B2 protein [Sphingomicrobium sp.]